MIEAAKRLPILETERLILRPRRMEDTEACLSMDREPEVTRHVRGPWHDAAAHRAFIEMRMRGPYPEGLGYWSLFARSAPTEFLGWVLLIPEDAQGPDVEIGWRLRRIAWGQGYATEAARGVLRHAFETAGLGEVVAEIASANAASLAVARKLGFVEIPRRTAGEDTIRLRRRAPL